jgi:hypothetical protein
LPNLPGYLQKDPTSVYYAYDSYVKELESRLQSSYAVVRRNLETAKFDNKKLYDRHTYVPKFEVGNFVLVKDESVRRGRSKKLEAAYIGPYEVIRIEGPNLVVLLLFVVYLTTLFQYLRLYSVDFYSILIRLPSSSEAGETRVRNMAEFCRRGAIVLVGFFYMP